MHHWKNLIFDIQDPTDRNKYQYGHDGDNDPGKELPITHKSDPLYHGVLCSLVEEAGISMLASEGINFSVSVVATIPLNIPVESAPDDVDFTTLPEVREAMRIAYEDGQRSR